MRFVRVRAGAAAAALALLPAVLAACANKDASRGATSDSGSPTGPSRASAGGRPGSAAQVAGAERTPERVDYYAAATLARVGDSLAGGTRTGRVLRSTEMRQYIEGRRDAPGTPEVHDHWTDVAFVQAGRATLVTGGRVEGGRLESAGEHRGGRIVGGVERIIGPGDLLIIPAGVPHQYVIARGDSLRYVTVKVREGAGR